MATQDDQMSAAERQRIDRDLYPYGKPVTVTKPVKCEDCYYWHRENLMGQCRKGPPVMVAVKTDTGEVDTKGYWPRTGSAAWCGGFSRKLDLGASRT